MCAAIMINNVKAARFATQMFGGLRHLYEHTYTLHKNKKSGDNKAQAGDKNTHQAGK